MYSSFCRLVFRICVALLDICKAEYLYHSHNNRTSLYTPKAGEKEASTTSLKSGHYLLVPFRGFSLSLSSLNRSSAHELFLQIAAAEHESRSMEICSALGGGGGHMGRPKALFKSCLGLLLSLPYLYQVFESF